MTNPTKARPGLEQRQKLQQQRQRKKKERAAKAAAAKKTLAEEKARYKEETRAAEAARAAASAAQLTDTAIVPVDAGTGSQGARGEGAPSGAVVPVDTGLAATAEGRSSLAATTLSGTKGWGLASTGNTPFQTTLSS